MTTDAELRALAEAATGGNWIVEPGEELNGVRQYDIVNQLEDDPPLAIVPFGEREEDARYIAAASPARVLALLDRVAALERVAEAARAVHDGGSGDDWDAQAAAWDALRDALAAVHR